MTASTTLSNKEEQVEGCGLEGPLLEFRAVSKAFGVQRVLDGFHLTLGRGEVVALLGPSGCGKTTVLNAAAGLVDPDEGRVIARAARVGYVFQEPRLIPWKTALENVLFALPASKKKRGSPEAMRLLSRLGLKEAADVYPRKLSGGMKQRVSIARMLVCEPDLLLMDEPFSALDVVLKQRLQDELIGLLEDRRKGALYATHDPKEAARLADRLFVMAEAGVWQEIPVEKPRRDREGGYLERMAGEISDHLMEEERV